MSQPVEHLVDRCPIFLLSLKTDTLDSLREFSQVCRDRNIVATFSVDVTDVGVHGDLFHVATIQDQGTKSTDCGRFGDRHINSVKQCSDFLLNRVC